MEKNNFIFTQHYQVDIAITVAGYAYQKFIAKVKQLVLENDPVESMNHLKPVVFRTFEMEFTRVSNDQTAARNLSNILQNYIKKTLIKKLQIEIVNNMKHESIHFRKKNHFKILVMKDLAAAKNFELYKLTLEVLVKALNTGQKSMSNDTVK